jgi:hypothetical protein
MLKENRSSIIRVVIIRRFVMEDPTPSAKSRSRATAACIACRKGRIRVSNVGSAVSWPALLMKLNSVLSKGRLRNASAAYRTDESVYLTTETAENCK